MRKVSISFTELMALADSLDLTVHYNSSDSKYDLYVYDYVQNILYYNTAVKSSNATQNEHYAAFGDMLAEGLTSTGPVNDEDEILYYTRIARSSPVVKKTYTTDLYTASLNYTTDFGEALSLKEIFMKFEWNMLQSDKVNITFDNGTGSTYDTLIAGTTMAGGKNLMYQPDSDLLLTSADEINISFANTGVTMSTDVYITVIGEVVR